MKRVLFSAIAVIAFSANVSFAQCCGSSTYISAANMQLPMTTAPATIVYQQAPVQMSSMNYVANSCCGQSVSYIDPVVSYAPVSYSQPMASGCCTSMNWSQPQAIYYSTPVDSTIVGSTIVESSDSETVNNEANDWDATDENSTADNADTTEQTFTSNLEEDADLETDSAQADADPIPAAMETGAEGENVADDTPSFDINGERGNGAQDVENDGGDAADSPFDGPEEDTE